jgi:hypothetical protein
LRPAGENRVKGDNTPSIDVPRRPARRPVKDHRGIVHRSCYEACIANNVSPAAGYYRARAGRQGWSFVDEAPRQPAASSSQEG